MLLLLRLFPFFSLYLSFFPRLSTNKRTHFRIIAEIVLLFHFPRTHAPSFPPSPPQTHSAKGRKRRSNGNGKVIPVAAPSVKPRILAFTYLYKHCIYSVRTVPLQVVWIALPAFFLFFLKRVKCGSLFAFLSSVSLLLRLSKCNPRLKAHTKERKEEKRYFPPAFKRVCVSVPYLSFFVCFLRPRTLCLVT